MAGSQDLDRPIDLTTWKQKKNKDTASSSSIHQPSGLIVVRSNMETVFESILGYKLPEGDPAKVFFTQLQTGFSEVPSLYVPIYFENSGHDRTIDMEFARHAARPELAVKIPEQHPVGGFLLIQYLDANTKRPMIEIVGIDDIQGLQTGRRESSRTPHALFAITLAATGFQKYELVSDPQNVFATDDVTMHPVQEVLSQFLIGVVGSKLPLDSTDRRTWARSSNGLNFFAYQFTPELPKGGSTPPRIA